MPGDANPHDGAFADWVISALDLLGGDTPGKGPLVIVEP
jgi:hypothetical protein